MDIREQAKKVAKDIRKETEVVKGERSKDKVFSSKRTFQDEETTKREFARSKERLFDVNAWSDIPGLANSNFRIHNPAGTPADHKIIMVGDFIRIDLPGPAPYYWVEVIDMVEKNDLAEFTVRPSQDPTDPGSEEVVAHFFHEDARSVFRVERQGNTIRAMEIGTDESINNQGEEAGERKVINTVISETGWAFFQKKQWENLTDYLVGNT